MKKFLNIVRKLSAESKENNFFHLGDFLGFSIGDFSICGRFLVGSAVFVSWRKSDT